MQTRTQRVILNLRKMQASCCLFIWSFLLSSSVLSSQPVRYHLEGKLVADYYKSSTPILHHNATSSSLSPKKPTVLLFGGSEGGIVEDEYIVDQLLSRGFNVMAVGYFAVNGYPDLPPLLNQIELANFEELINHVAAREDSIDTNCLGVIGGSKSGELALVLSGYMPNIRTVVASTPANVVFQGLPVVPYNEYFFSDLINALTLPAAPSWVYKGEDLPYVPTNYLSFDNFVSYLSGSLNFTKFYQDALNKQENHASEIKIENINGPVLLISAKRDRIWPSYPMSKAAYKRLRHSRFKYLFEHSSYDTDHELNAEAYFEAVVFVAKQLPRTCHPIISN